MAGHVIADRPVGWASAAPHSQWSPVQKRAAHARGHFLIKSAPSHIAKNKKKSGQAPKKQKKLMPEDDEEEEEVEEEIEEEIEEQEDSIIEPDVVIEE